jgi:hypothetical protein
MTNVARATIEINVTAVAGVRLSSQAWSGASVLASSGWSGAWNAEIMSGPNTGFKFLSFCTDMGNTMVNGTWTYEQTGFSAANNTGNNDGIAPDPSWANFGVSGQRASLIYNNNIGSVNSAISRTAMAIAIWEALYEDGLGTGGVGFNVSTKNTDTLGRGFTVTATNPDAVAAVAMANSWLGALNGGALGGNFTWFAEMETPDVQSLIGPILPVPEPGTYLAGALLLLPILASRVNAWRRKRA